MPKKRAGPCAVCGSPAGIRCSSHRGGHKKLPMRANGAFWCLSCNIKTLIRIRSYSPGPMYAKLIPGVVEANQRCPICGSIRIIL